MDFVLFVLKAKGLNETAQEAIELAKGLARMSDEELHIAMDIAHEDLCKTNHEFGGRATEQRAAQYALNGHGAG